MKLFVCFMICVIGFSCATPLEIRYDRVELLNSTFIEGIYNISTFRISKFNHTAHVLNVNFELFINLDRNFFLEVYFHHNRLNNNQYTRSLLQVPNTNACFLLDKFWNVGFGHLTRNDTNLPEMEPRKGICPIEKVRFQVIFLICFSFIDLIYSGKILAKKLHVSKWKTGTDT